MLFTIKKAGSKGKGVFAAQDIPAGRAIWTFSGIRYSWLRIAELIDTGLERPNDPFQISENFFLKLDLTSVLFNHSCDPNAGFRNGRELIAIRDIRKGEEICYDYSTVVCTHCDWSMECICKATTCRKKVGTARTIPHFQLKRYSELRILPAYVEKEVLHAKSRS